MLKDKTLSQVHKKAGDSHFCMNLVGITDILKTPDALLVCAINIVNY